MDVTELFCRYRDDVYRLALSYTRRPQEAEDVCQTVFLKLVEKNAPEPGKERAWLMQVTANQCRSLLRSAWWKRQVPLEAAPVCDDRMPDRSVYRAVMSLKPKYRVVVYLHYYEGYSTGEIAALLKLSTTAVTTRLSRAREKLRNLLKED